MAAERATYDHAGIVEAGQPVSPLYDERKNALQGLPQTTLEPETASKPKMPNIFSARNLPEIWIQHENGIPMYAISSKADVGGVGGHVEVADEVKATGVDFILRHNRMGPERGRAIFRSLMATHCGDDVAFTGIVDERAMEHEDAIQALLYDTFLKGAEVAAKLGLYGPGQDLRADAYTGNIHGMGPAYVVLPLPKRSSAELSRNASQSVVAAFGDKTEPALMNWMTNYAYRKSDSNTGMTIAESRMRLGYIFDIVDVNTKQQALEMGVPYNDEAAMNQAMRDLGKNERVIRLADPQDSKYIDMLMTGTTRYVIEKVWSKDDNGDARELGVVVSAERLHNIETPRGFVYGGKDDPVMLALAQGDWPAPGEITSKLSMTPLVNGDCRGSHRMPLYPAQMNSQTAFYSGPIIQVGVMSVNLETGIIGDVSDQLATHTAWDKYRMDAADRGLWIRAHGSMEPAVLGPDELEYQPQVKRLTKELADRFHERPVATPIK